jgi:NADPH-dependent 2,4-dienoyl-CoA reductase/sulfur reductase-like enzyme
MNVHVKYLLVGGGFASSAAAEAIRALDADAPLMLATQEPIRPYHRPPLSKQYLTGEKGKAYLFTQPTEWFAQNRVELRTGLRAVQIDATRKSVTFTSGQEISFDKLLLAIGCSQRPLNLPGSDYPNVYALRSIDDTERLRHAIDQAKAEGRKHDRGRGVACVIGAGVLGVELSASLTRLGLQTHLICPHDHPWTRFAGESTGRFLTRYLESQGVRVHLQHRATSLEGDGRVQRIVLSSGEVVEADLVAAAVGSRLNTELLRNTHIEAERAILTDAHARTSVPDIYAAGDCAAIYDPLFGKHRWFDHWDHAIRTGALAGRNMAGADEAFADVTYFFSDVFDLSLAAWGEGKRVSRRLIRGVINGASSSFIEIGVDDRNRVAQVLALRTSGDQPDLSWLVRQRIDVTGMEEQLKDPAFAMEGLRT